MVGSNKSIVANRMALRMANLSAADMIKAELASGGQPPLAQAEDEVDGAEMQQEKQAEEAGRAEAERNSAAAAKLKAEMLGSQDDDVTSPRGTKRAAPPVEGTETQDSTDVDAEPSEALAATAGEGGGDAEVNAFLESSLLPPKPAMIAGLNVAEPPTLKMLGNNVVEQDDTVKCAPLCFRTRVCAFR